MPGSTFWERIVSDPINGGCNGTLDIPADTTDGVSSKRYNIWDVANGQGLPDQAYYSFWLAMWPGITFADGGYLSPMDWGKQYDDAGVIADSMTHSVAIKPDPNSEGYLLTMGSYHTENNEPHWQGTVVESKVPFYGGVWNHFEFFYKWSQDKTGRITAWQNGKEIWDLQGIYFPEIHNPTGV